MNWETPRYAAIRMDAEVGSYQEDWAPPEFDERASPSGAPGLAEGSLPTTAATVRQPTH
jgi:hypothetical protein